MLRFNFQVAPSLIPCAGLGLFTTEAIPRGKILVVPNQVHEVYSRVELMCLPPDSAEFNSSIRWFEDGYTVDPEKSDIFFINHAFAPNCLWHLGFIFALEDIAAGSELTIDYRVLMDDGEEVGFTDSVTGRLIRGFGWNEKMVFTSRALLHLYEGKAAKTSGMES